VGLSDVMHKICRIIHVDQSIMSAQRAKGREQRGNAKVIKRYALCSMLYAKSRLPWSKKGGPNHEENYQKGIY